MEHLSRLTRNNARKLLSYAAQYKIHIRGGFTVPENGDTIYYMIKERPLVAFVHCTPYGYLINVIIEDGEEGEEVFLYMRNVRTFFSRIKRAVDGDHSALR